MKILIVFNHPAPYKVDLFNQINKELPIEVIFERSKAKNRDSKFYFNKEMNFKYQIIDKGNFSDENSFSFKIKNIIKNNNYDLIVMNGYSTLSEMITINYLNKKHIPWILMINGGIIKNDNYFKKLIKTHYISSASSYLSPCLESDKYLKYYGAKNKIYNYPYSTIYENEILDKPINLKEKQLLKQELNLPDKKVFIAPSQFIKRKNNEFLLDIFKDLPNYFLLLVGSGKLLNKYKTFIKKHNLNNVRIINYLSKQDLIKYYRASDALINLSKEDIYCHTINEALGQGIPCIASNCIVSANHLIKDCINGYVVNLKNKKDIVNAMNKVDNNMSINCLKIAKENTIEKSAEKIIKIFKELAK